MSPKTSKRLIRAAQAEQPQLEAQRAELLQRREQVQEELEALERRLHAVDETMRLLQRLAGAAPARKTVRKQVEVRTVNGCPRGGGDTLVLLRGTAIRERAAHVLLERGAGPIHYRDWHDLLRKAGYAVSGKDPQATLLTQICRSPVVRRTTAAGVYEIDPEAPERLRSTLASLQRELRELTSARARPDDAARLRTRRDELVGHINATERALDEAERVLARSTPRPAESAA